MEAIGLFIMASLIAGIAFLCLVLWALIGFGLFESGKAIVQAIRKAR